MAEEKKAAPRKAEVKFPISHNGQEIRLGEIVFEGRAYGVEKKDRKGVVTSRPEPLPFDRLVAKNYLRVIPDPPPEKPPAAAASTDGKSGA